jgi:hypothetical protein
MTIQSGWRPVSLMGGFLFKSRVKQRAAAVSAAEVQRFQSE